MRKKLYVLCLLSVLIGYATDSSEDARSIKNLTTKTRSYKVIGIKDGDTFVVLMNGRAQVVRLEHIDCPEKKQAFGTKAKQFASNLCYGKFVQLQSKNKYDRYKRLIAEVILPNGLNVNKALVKNGLAWHYKKHSKSSEYAQLEHSARQQRRGVWSDPNPVAPWEWRKRRR
ncbi:thermonuclease family protein [Flavobacterium sp.]|uniref:thermonuclease family protein n=1 Tax=Flavobacterium sp. TaxID=239 RepID=UPI00260A3FD2|nr:thermonuclease family protein [Flavobacterium sp.]